MTPGRGIRTPRARRDGLGDYLAGLPDKRLIELAQQTEAPPLSRHPFVPRGDGKSGCAVCGRLRVAHPKTAA